MLTATTSRDTGETCAGAGAPLIAALTETGVDASEGAKGASVLVLVAGTLSLAAVSAAKAAAFALTARLRAVRWRSRSSAKAGANVTEDGTAALVTDMAAAAVVVSI